MPDEPDFSDLLSGASAAVLTTYRRDGSALTSPVWVALGDGAFEIVMTAKDGKVKNLQRDARCVLVIFETSPPFRGVEARADAELETGSRVDEVRRRIASRYLGEEGGARFTSARADVPSVIVRVPKTDARSWDLSKITAD